MIYRLHFLPRYYILLSFTIIVNLILLLPLAFGKRTFPLWLFISIWAIVLSFIFIHYLFNLSSLKIEKGVLYIYGGRKSQALNSYMGNLRGGGQGDSFPDQSLKLDPLIKVECSNIKKISKVTNLQTIINLRKSRSTECSLVLSNNNVLEIEFKKPLEYAGGVPGIITPNLPPLKKVFISVVGIEQFLKDLKKNM